METTCYKFCHQGFKSCHAEVLAGAYCRSALGRCRPPESFLRTCGKNAYGGCVPLTYCSPEDTWINSLYFVSN